MDPITPEAVFYVFDEKKGHGHVWNPKDRLYHLTDKQHLKKIVKDLTIVTIQKDLRSCINLYEDKLPIGDDILQVSTGQMRKREKEDYFSFVLMKSENPDRFEGFMKRMIHDTQEYLLLKEFLYNSLTSTESGKFLLLKGNEDSMKTLFECLSKLDPLVKTGRSSLYCEAYINKLSLQEIQSARIILVNIEDRTLRVGVLPSDKRYERSLQHHALVYQKNAIQDTGDYRKQTIKLSKVSQESFSEGEILGWILQK